jgi:NADH:ubiquinone oxidoreductase subunit K|tara:strand:+ start:2287 stop:2595 length:309 start_codon:yes stop_codon:yes gene_type:complete
LESALQYLIVSVALFAIGVYGLIAKRNAIRLLFSIEIIANSAILNLVVFSRYLAVSNVTGRVFALFAIALLAAEAAVGLSLILAAYRIRKDIDVLEMREMRG